MSNSRKRGIVLPELFVFIGIFLLIASGLFLRASIKNSRLQLAHDTENFVVWLMDSMSEARIQNEVFTLDIVNVYGDNYMAVKKYVYGPRTGKQETWVSDSIDMRPDQITTSAKFDGREEAWGTALSFTFRRRRGNPMTRKLTVTPLGYLHLEDY